MLLQQDIQVRATRVIGEARLDCRFRRSVIPTLKPSKHQASTGEVLLPKMRG